MALSKNLKNLIVLLTILFSSGCQHEFVNTNIIQLTSIKFNSSISNSLKERSKQYFVAEKISNAMQDSSLTIHKLEFKKRNFYGGSNVRSKEIEILGELHYEFNMPTRLKVIRKRSENIKEIYRNNSKVVFRQLKKLEYLAHN